LNELEGDEETNEEVKTATEKLENEVRETLDKAGLGKLKGKIHCIIVFDTFCLVKLLA